MREPTPLLNAAVLQSILGADLRSGSKAVTVWNAIVDHIDDEDALTLPESVGHVLRLMAADPYRLSLTLDLVAGFDLFEAAQAVATFAVDVDSPDAALLAAAFARHPGVPASLGDFISDSLPRRVSMSEDQRLAFGLRLRPSTDITEGLVPYLISAAWPGLNESATVPPIYVAELHAPAAVRFRMMGAIRSLDLRLRRIPSEWMQDPPREWFTDRAHVVGWTGVIVGELKKRGWSLRGDHFMVGPQTDSQIPPFLRRLSEIAGTPLRWDRTLTPSPLRDRVLSPDLMELGSFDVRDMAFLGGGQLGSVYKLGRGPLQPRYLQASHRTPLWSFAQLIAYRTWHYLSSVVGRRHFPTSLVHRLESMARSFSVAEVGVNSSGVLFQKEGDEWVDIVTGQEAIRDVLAMDRVFLPFPIGGGHVPDLLQPSRFTITDPAIVGGTPILSGTRIPARAVAAIERKQGSRVLLSAFPDLDRDGLLDAAAVGRRLLDLE